MEASASPQMYVNNCETQLSPASCRPSFPFGLLRQRVPFRRKRSERAESPSRQSRTRRHRHAVRLAVSLGGDSDTLACITGGIAEAFYGPIPEAIANAIWSRLPDGFHRILREMKRVWGYPLAGSIG